MTSIRLAQNPGIGGLDELTAAEELVIQQITGLGDPNADRILFWDDSAGSFQYLTVGTGLSITDTTITATGSTLDGSGTTNELVYWVDSDTLGALAVATYPSLTELSYVKGVTSAIQTQLNAKQASDAQLTSVAGLSYTGNALKVIRVNAGETDFELATPGSGDVVKVGTPVDNQVGVWTGDGTIEGGTGLVFDGDILTITNNTDAASNQGLIIQSDRATPANNDEVYMTFRISDSAGNQDEFGRITVRATDVTSTSEDGRMDFSIIQAGSLVSEINLIQDSLRPTTSDGVALGSGTNMWSDLFLASGGVINFNNGDVTLTHSTDTLTMAGGTLVLPASGLQVGSSNPFSDSAGTLTLQNVDALDATTEATIEAAIDTLANLTSIQSQAISLSAPLTIPADPGADRLFFWDDSETATAWLTLGNGLTITTTSIAVDSASTTVDGIVELAIDTEVTTGTDATRAVTPDSLAGSNIFGRKAVSIQITDGTTDVTTGDGKAYITIPESLNGMNLVRAQATVVTAGTTNATTIMIHNKTDAADMLSGAISIASAGTVATVGTINGSADDVATNDVLRIDVDSVSTTAPKGLMVVLEFQLP